MSTVAESIATVERHALLFPDAVHQVSLKAQASLPEQMHGRIQRATALVLEGGVFLADDGHTCQVRASNGNTWYSVNGACTCKDHERAPESLCKHRLASAIYRRASELMCTPQPTVAETINEVPATSTADEHCTSSEPVGQAPHVPAQYIVHIQGKPFIRAVGLLALAHERGLQSLKTVFTYNDAALSLAECTAVFPFGTFTDVGDASPENVTKKVAPHFRRVAATRATARALRQALNIDMCALEELGE